MKNKSFLPFQATAGGLLLGSLLLITASASAQNLVKNPDFEQPLGPDNWTVVYTNNSGPFDFLIAGRSTIAHKDLVLGTWDGGASANFLTNYWSKLGGHFAPNYCNAKPQAYFKQVVTGLQPGGVYTASAWMVQYTRNDSWLALAQIYMEAMSGPTGTTSKRTAFVTANANNNPGGWQRYSISNVSASISGQIEIRLHYKVIDDTAQVWEYRNMNAFYDHVSLVPQGPSNPMPPYQITTFQRADQDILLKWNTLMNNKYRLQVSSDVANPASWSYVLWNRKWDTNIHATGTSHTFQTNLLSLFSYDPSFDPDAPLFFRIYSEPFVP